MGGGGGAERERAGSREGRAGGQVERAGRKGRESGHREGGQGVRLGRRAGREGGGRERVGRTHGEAHTSTNRGTPARSSATRRANPMLASGAVGSRDSKRINCDSRGKHSHVYTCITHDAVMDIQQTMIGQLGIVRCVCPWAVSAWACGK